MLHRGAGTAGTSEVGHLPCDIDTFRGTLAADPSVRSAGSVLHRSNKGQVPARPRLQQFYPDRGVAHGRLVRPGGVGLGLRGASTAGNRAGSPSP